MLETLAAPFAQFARIVGGWFAVYREWKTPGIDAERRWGVRRDDL